MTASVAQFAIFFLILTGVCGQFVPEDNVTGLAVSIEMDLPIFPNIVAAALATDVLSTLVDAVIATQLDVILGDPKLEATVFAPTVDAFNETLDDLGMTFEDLASDPEFLFEILTFHVVPQVAFAADLSDGMVLPTLNGGNLTVIITDSEVLIDGEESTASVISTDITAGMAVVHLIDSILIP